MSIIDKILTDKGLQVALLSSPAIEPNHPHGNDYYQQGYRTCATRVMHALEVIKEKLNDK